jgi:hypothetical protein
MKGVPQPTNWNCGDGKLVRLKQRSRGQFASESTVFQSGAEIGSRLSKLHLSLEHRVSLLQTFGDFGSVAIALELNPTFRFRAKP